MTGHQGTEFVAGADGRPPAATLAAGHFWRQPFRFGLRADDGHVSEVKQAGGEPDADRQDVLTWCDSEN